MKNRFKNIQDKYWISMLYFTDDKVYEVKVGSYDKDAFGNNKIITTYHTVSWWKAIKFFRKQYKEYSNK